MTTVTLETGGDLLRRIDALLKTLADEYKVRLNAQEGLSVTAVDPANVGMLSFEVPPSAFETFDLDYDGVTVGLPRKRLSGIARYARKGGNSNDDPGDPVRLLWDEDSGRFYVHVERDDVERYTSFASLDPDSIREEPTVPDLSFPWESSLDSGVLRDVTRALGQEDYGHVQLAAEDLSNGVSGDPTASVRLYAKGDDGLGEREDVFRPGATATFVEDRDAEAVASLYSLDYLRDMAKGVHAAKPDAVKVEFGDEYPLKIHFSESDYGLSGTFMLAPRVRSVSSDTPGYTDPSFDADLFRTDDADDEGDENDEDAPEVGT